MKIESTEICAPPNGICQFSGKIWGAFRSPEPAIVEGHVLEDERHADGGDQGRQPRRVAERSVDDALDARR